MFDQSGLFALFTDFGIAFPKSVQAFLFGRRNNEGIDVDRSKGCIRCDGHTA